MSNLEVCAFVVSAASAYLALLLAGPPPLAVAVVVAVPVLVPVPLLPLLAAPRRVHEVRVEPEQVKIERDR